MNKFLFASILVLFGWINAFSTEEANSFEEFKSELLSEKVDSLRAINFARISFAYLSINVDSSFHYANKTLSLSEELDFDLGKAFGHSLVALSYAAKNVLDSAIIQLQFALELYQDLNDSLGIADTYGNLSFIFDRTNQFEKAVEYGLKDKEIRVLERDTVGLINSLSNLLTFYLNKEDISAAEKVVAEMKELMQNDHDKLLNQVVAQSEGMILYAKGEYSAALEYFNRSLAQMDPFTEKVDWAFTSSYQGKCLYYMGELKKARVAIDSSIKVYEEVGSWVYKYDDYLFMARIDSAMGNFQSALQWHMIFVEKELSRMNNQKIVELNLLQDKFESKLKEAENKSLIDQNNFQELIISRQRIIGVAIIVCLIVMGILAVYLLRVNIIIKQKSELAEKQKMQIEVQNERLERLNEVKSKMISIISHDFRSPLVSVQSTMNILEQMGNSEQTMRQLLPELKNKVNYAAELVDNLLLWANDHLDGTQINAEEFEMKSFLERKTIYFQDLAKRKGVRLILEELTNTHVHTDKRLLHSVYRNLLSNALKFTPKGGEIRVSAFEADDSVILTIADNGMGMDEQTQENIRLGQSVSRIGTNKEMGSGLGLLICQDFIKRLKGSFHFDSTVGKGTQFYVQIPKNI